MNRIPTFVAILMAVLALPSLLWVLLNAPPVTKATTGEVSSWFTWLSGLPAVAGFGIASYLSYMKDRRWPLAVLLICGYVAIFSTPSMILMWIEGGFFDLTELIWTHATMAGGSRGFYLIWSLFVLPIVPALILPLATWCWWKTYRGFEWI